MIEKKTVSLYLNNMMQALKIKMFQTDYHKPYLILAHDVIQCVENIESIIQKEPLPEGETTTKTPEIEKIKKIIESLSVRMSSLENIQFTKQDEITDTERLNFIEKIIMDAESIEIFISNNEKIIMQENYVDMLREYSSQSLRETIDDAIRKINDKKR